MCNFYGKHTTIHKKKPFANLPIPETLPADVIIGWKSWSTGMRGGYGYPWEPGKIVHNGSMTGRKPHPLGTSDGIYSYMKENVPERVPPLGTVFGEVLLWGEIKRYTNNGGGYRAQYAYPVSLFATSLSTAESLLRAWGPSGVYVNYYVGEGMEGADKKGFYALLGS